MPTAQQTQAEIREHLAEQLDWRFAERNDRAVAQALYAGRAVDGVHTLDEAGLLDGFFAFLKAAGVMTVWQQFQIEGVQRIFLPALYFGVPMTAGMVMAIKSHRKRKPKELVAKDFEPCVKTSQLVFPSGMNLEDSERQLLLKVAKKARQSLHPKLPPPKLKDEDFVNRIFRLIHGLGQR